MIKTGQLIGSFVIYCICTATFAEPLSRKAALDLCERQFNHSEVDLVSLRTALSEEIDAYELLVEKSLTYRSETIQTFKQLNSKLDEGKPLSGKDLDILTDGMVAHLDLRDDLYAVANKYRCWGELKKSNIDSETQLRGAVMALSATMMLYDNYLLAISLFEEDHKLRRYLNEERSGYNIARAKLREITFQYNSVLVRTEVREGIKFFQEQWAKTDLAFKLEDQNQYLALLIMQSPSYNSTLRVSPLYVLNQQGKFFRGFTTDALSEIKETGTNLFSMAFGNTMGLVQVRKGLLYEDEVVEQTVQQSLRAGDILLEKTPFRLTDKFIPGYWGHVAIWVGTEKELKALDIWNHEVVLPFQDDIRAGNNIVEALRPGVSINPLSHFLNVDDLAVLRRSQHSDQEKRDVIIKALRQVGKPYDFNFDIETTDKIVCSELIYVTYTDIDWPTDKALGRYTISPTHVAEKSGLDDNAPFSVVALYLQGKPVTDNLHQSFARLQ